MEPAGLEKRKKEHDDYQLCLRQWLKLTCQYARDAATELWAIYSSLVPPTTPKAKRRKHAKAATPPVGDASPTFNDDFRHRFDVILGSADGSVLYIYMLGDGILRFGPDASEYPLLDASLWPWSVASKKVPSISRDVYQCIMSHMTPYEVLNFALGKSDSKPNVVSAAN